MTLGSFDDDFGIILGSFWNHFGIFLELFWDHNFRIFHWGNQVLIIGGTRPRGLGEPTPPRYTIRFSILIVRTPKASLVGE